MSFKGLILLALCMCSFLLKAQFNNDFLYYVKYGNSVNLDAEYDLNSTAIQNDLMDKFIYGGHIDSAAKSRSQKRLQAQNRLGGTVSTGVTAFWGPKGSKFHFMAGLKEVDILNAGFRSDVYNLAFNGNQAYEGRTANLGNTSVNNYTYQEIKLGLIWDKDSSIKIGVSVSYLKGQSLAQLSTGAASVYTAADASQLNFALNGSLAMSDTGKGKNSLGSFNGNGASLELFAEVPYKSILGASKLLASVNNLGFIGWNKNTVSYHADTAYSFRGVTVNNVFQVNNASIKNLSKDSLTKNLSQSSRHTLTTYLPVSFFVLHSIDFTKLFALNTGFRYLLNANYKPYVYAEGRFAICKTFNATAHAGYGGYGKLSCGVNVECKLKTWYLRLGSNAIQGYVAPQHSLGQGLFFSLSKKI
jgi:hypothetical protein